MAQGRNLFIAADNIRRASADLNALWESIFEALECEAFGDGVATKRKKGDSSYSTVWINPIFEQTFEIRKPSKKDGSLGKVTSTISVAIRLCGNSDVSDEPAFPWSDQATLIVAWHPCDEKWSAWDFEADHAELIQHSGQGLYSWDGGGPDAPHLYALPLFAMRTEKDIAAFVVAPLKIFFKDGDPANQAEAAFAEVPVLHPDT